MKIALVGNQNSGKTTLFNTLTGMNAKIGNWPGVTIEKKVGKVKNTYHEITDLPGIYSLSPYSMEEEISSKYIFEEKPEVIINIVDSTSLERSLYLTTQLLELDCKVIVALNMSDILEQRGIKIDVAKLEKLLGTRVIKISALKKTGIRELIYEIERKSKIERKYIYSSKIEMAIKEIENQIKQKHKRFIAVKLLEADERFKNINTENIRKITEEISKKYDTDLEEIIASQRYEFIEKIKKQTVEIDKTKEKISDKLDKIFLNKYLAFPIFIAIMFMVYYLSVGVVGKGTVEYISNFVKDIKLNAEIVLENMGASKWLNSLIVNGVITGVGAVLNFVPQLIILFMCIALLETTGYMSRIAFLLDKIFIKIGLSGKSLIPFIVGSGCSVPGIMGTRIIENQTEKEITTIVTPFIPCSAKLPIIALFSEYFFKENSGVVSASIYFLAIVIIIVSSFILKKIIYKAENTTYITELPEYKKPSITYLMKEVSEKTIAFIKRAGSIILICSIVIWFLLSFSFELEYGINIENSMLATIGKTISWIFYPILGENSWGATVSAIQGLVAKEQVISSMTVISGFSENEGIKMFERGGMFEFFNKSSAYAFIIFNLFSAPCFGAIGAMRRELGSNKKTIKAIAFQTIFAWILGSITYKIGRTIETKTFNIANAIILTTIILCVFIIIKKGTTKNECRNCPYCNS